MKIAVINDSSSLGGLRYLTHVLGSIKKYYPDTEIKIFLQNNINIDCQKYFGKYGIDVCDARREFNILRRFKKYKKKNSIKNKIKLLLLKKIKYKRMQKFVNDINSFDLVFFTWISDGLNTDILKYIDVPIFCIQHDFIFSHFFGLHVTNTYINAWYRDVKNTLKCFINRGATFIGSSQYVIDELKRVFPEYKKGNNVVYLSALNDTKSVETSRQNEILKKFGIDFDFIFYPTNNMHHKNMEEVLSGYYYVKQKYPNIKLIICGFATDGIRVQINTPYYCDHIEENEDYDIKSLGLVSNEELITLIQKAKLLVNASLCEAACGSGLDAWQLGCPTAISDIPCYKQQVEKLGVKTEFFDPKCAKDIGNAMLRILDNPELAKNNSEISKQALEKHYTKKDVADGYMRIFNSVKK